MRAAKLKQERRIQASKNGRQQIEGIKQMNTV